MKYYETLVFNTWGEVPAMRSMIQRKFKGYYGIQYNHAGTLTYTRDQEPEQVVPGASAFFTYPGPVFQYGPLAGTTRHHCFVCFSGSLIRRFISGGLLDLERKNPVIPVVNAEKFYRSFHQLISLIAQPGGSSSPRAAWHLEDLLLQLQEQPGNCSKVNPYCRQELQALRAKIAEQPQLAWDFAEEARRMSVSYPHFRRIFREVIGISPQQFLIEMRLDYASRLLEKAALPIAEVAHQSGFADEFYFSRLFKKHRLIPPSAIRGSKLVE